MRPPENPQEADAWYQTMEEGVRKWAAAEDRQTQIKNLGEYVRKFGRRMPDFPDPRWHETFKKAQESLLAIPGHAQHFADVIEKERKGVEDIPFNLGPRINYDFNRRIFFETLANLPSPETIKVLGDYLADERDLYELTPEQINGQSCISGGSTGNSTLSAKALEDSALRNKPYQVGTVYDNRLTKAAWRAWWEEIKSGNKTFSFTGQKVGYRFNPDGTWESIAIANPPDDAPKPLTPTAERPQKPRIPSDPAGEFQKSRNHWQWVVISIATLLVPLIWLVAKRASGKT